MVNANTEIEKSYYTEEFFHSLRNYSKQSADIVVPLILEIIPCRRVIDVGCGDGTWLKVFQENGVEEILGVDGDYVDEDTLVIPSENFISSDLKKPFKLEEKADLVISLEVAEHLPEECADSFINSLITLSPVILFSAAIPGQGGDNHINEQWQEYWAEKFQARGYVAIDYIRKKIWNHKAVAYWYSQNILLFIQAEYLEKHGQLQEHVKEYQVHDNSLVSVVHPEMFLIVTGQSNFFENSEKSHEDKKMANNAIKKLFYGVARKFKPLLKLS